MNEVARRLRWRGIGEYRDETEPLLEASGDVAGVVRGRPRSVVIACPDGCGDTLVINIDPRAGKAWDLNTRAGITLYPSVWREDGCRSHFIAWRDHVLWCGQYEEENVEPGYDVGLEGAVLAALRPNRYRTGYEIASELGEIVWDVLRVLRRGVRDGMVEEGRGSERDRFRSRS
jgi:hypothetical protein